MPESGTYLYRRVLLKLSGEALMGPVQYGISREVLDRVVNEIKSLYAAGIELGIVIGGGNIFRGVSTASEGMNRVNADYMGMLATVINAMALKEALDLIGVRAQVQSALSIGSAVAPYNRENAIGLLEKKTVVIFASGTGNPFFTTDTAASLRGLEIEAEVVIKATKVDGVYDKDPEKHADAIRFESLTYDQILENHLEVMDAAAIALCRDHGMSLRVISINKEGSLVRAILDEKEGTMVVPGAG